MAEQLPDDLEDETPEQVRARIAATGGLPDDLEEAPAVDVSSVATSPRAIEGPVVAPRNPGALRAIGSELLQGAFKGGSDEAIGAITSAAIGPETTVYRKPGELLPSTRDTPSSGAAWQMPDGSVRFLETEGDVYRAGRDTEREVLRGAETHYPKTAFASRLAGDVLSDAALKALGVPGVGGRAYNIATGALSGLLGSEAEMTPDKATELSVAQGLAQAGLGGYMGKYATDAGAMAARIAPQTLRLLRTFLESGAVSMGRRTLLAGADSLAGNVPVPDAAVREALASGAILPGGTTQGAFKRLEESAKEYGDFYGSILDQLEAAGVRGPVAEQLAKTIAARGDELAPTAGVANPAVTKAYDDVAGRLEQAARTPEALEAAARARAALQGIDIPSGPPGPGTMGLRQAEEVKRGLQEQAYYGKIEDTPVNEAKKEIASIVRQANEDAVDAAVAAAPQGPSGDALRALGESFQPAKQRLGNILEARGAAKRGAAAADKRSMFGLPDYIAAAGALGGGGAASGDTGLGLGAGAGTLLLTNLLRRRGPSTVASAAYGLSRAAGAGARAAANEPAATRALLERTAARGARQVSQGDMVDELAHVNPAALGPYAPIFERAAAEGNTALTHWHLQQTDPQYRALLESLRKEQQ